VNTPVSIASGASTIMISISTRWLGFPGVPS
jgi:hypothetical protein